MEPAEFASSRGYELDPYQVEAMTHISNGLSVLVAAPTGSGKTLVAEYALERVHSAGGRFFYTTPLKALSNQKFRDLMREFPPGEVGLLTGDNSINGDASIVVMTTEVLRNMMYEGSELLHDLGAVVLDECHYMHDPFRGAVWEEIIIQLSADVKIIALSATVSNAREMSEWMDSLRGDVRVVLSDERPVRLKNEYFIGRSLVPLFQKNIQRVITDEGELARKAEEAKGGRRRRSRRSALTPRRVDVIGELKRREMLPALYFLFSRAACDDSVGMYLTEGRGLTTPDEARRIADYLDEKVGTLPRADLDCLNYGRFKDALTAGVAAHHAGELPLFKEAVEELFASGLIKVVFATETLSLGINMPARTVVIESLSKWAGDRHRPLTPGEYKQLTGRAGRRGIDEVGYAVVLYQNYFSVESIRSLVTREPNPVVSSFQVTYNMAVNLLAEHDLDEATRLINLSFAQFVADRRVVDLESRLEAMKEDVELALEEASCGQGGDATAYRTVERNLSELSRRLANLTKDRRQSEIRDVTARLQPGDVFTVGRGGARRVVALVKRQKEREGERGLLVVDSLGRYRRMNPRTLGQAPRVVGTVDVSKVTSPTRKVRRSVGDRMESMADKGGEAASRAMSDEEASLDQAVSDLKHDLAVHLCHSCEHRQRCLEAARRAERLQRAMRGARRDRDSGHDVVSKRLVDVVEVLGEHGFMDAGKPTEKGELLRRVYNECDLLLVEALSRGLLSRVEPGELASLASWFVYESREGDAVKGRIEPGEEEHLAGILSGMLDELQDIEEELKGSEERRGLDLLGSLDIGFGEVAYAWAGGAELEEMMERFPERSVGDIVRNMKQVIDLLRQLADVSPDPVLTRNLRDTMRLVDRGIVGYSSIESIIEHEGADAT